MGQRYFELSLEVEGRVQEVGSLFLVERVNVWVLMGKEQVGDSGVAVDKGQGKPQQLVWSG